MSRRKKIRLYKEYKIESEEEIKEVKKFGTGGHITLSKDLIGRKVVVGVLND